MDTFASNKEMYLYIQLYGKKCINLHLNGNFVYNIGTKKKLLFL